jgi:DNA-binding beta-propeller fold protein YncE
MLAAAGIAFAVGALGPDASPVTDLSPSPSSSSTLQLTGDPVITAEIPLVEEGGRGGIGGVAVGAGSAWVSVQRGGTSSIVRIDLATNEVVAEIPVEDTPWRKRIAATEEAVWAASTGTLERIDPDTNTVVATVDMQGRPVSAIAADPTAVWAVAITEPADEAGEWTGTLVRVDPATNDVVAEIPLGPQVAGYEDEVMLGADSVWVLGVRWFEQEDAEYGSDLIRIDPATNQITARIPVGGFRMVMGVNEVWVRFIADGVFDTSDERLLWTRVDATTNEPSAPFEFGDNGLRLVTSEALWSVGSNDQEHVRVSRFDPESLELEASSEPIRSYYHDAVIDPTSGTVWVSAVWNLVRVDIVEDTVDATRPPFPLTYREGANKVMPIAFLNGTTAEMVYPASLPLDQVTIQPNGSLYDGVMDFSLNGLASKFVVEHSPTVDVEPIESYDLPLDGIVARLRAVPAGRHAVRLGPWIVDVPYEALTAEQHRGLLDHLFGLETEGGFLILEATPPLLLWPSDEGRLVTQMYLDVDDLQILDRCIDFSQAADDSFVRNGIEVFWLSEGAGAGADIWFWCDRTGELGVQVNEGPIAEALVDGLSFRNIRR